MFNELMVAMKIVVFHFQYGQCGQCVCQWDGGWFTVELFDCRSLGDMCAKSLLLFPASSFIGQRRLVVACFCPQLTHFGCLVLTSIGYSVVVV